MENSWKHADVNVFWGEIAPCDHVVQIYENDEVFLDLLMGYVAGGIKAGDCVIVIATSAHLSMIDGRLRKDGFNVFDLVLRDQYIPLNAKDALDEFMVDGWPDANLFHHLVSGLIQRGRKNKRQIRAFGEMVAVLWSEGNQGATVQLEHLWTKFCESEPFCLFCAYPKSGFTGNASESIMHICGAHSKVVRPAMNSDSVVMYQSVKAS
ncbi:MAG TPA: MEDS domain-containing protein [Cyclobacteriaceae bacterium]|nr:MEDS domain-containing protein [Cyclobacteriaceae bacterium]